MPHTARRVAAIALTMSLVPLAAPAVGPAGPAAASVLPRCGDAGTPAVVALHDPHFYVDSASTARLMSAYAGYRVEAGPSARSRLWLQLSGFTGGVVGLAAGQPAHTALPALPGGGSAARYLLLTATGTTTVPQGHTVTLYDGAPASGTPLCSRAFTYTDVVDTIKALANKVQSVTTSTPAATARLGDVVTVSVQGDTGTLGAGPPNDPGVLAYTPNALAGFPAGAWRLERTELLISPDGVAPPVTYVDRLYLTGAGGPARPYTARYVFRATGPSESAAPLKPIQYIASGTQVKHTDIGGTALGALPAVSATAPVTLGKEVTAPAGAILPAGGGVASYTLTLTNAADTAGLVDWVSDTLPADAAYQPGTMRIAGRAAADPDVDGRTLIVQGPIGVPAGGSTTMSYSVLLGPTTGARANSAVAHFGTVVLDRSADVTASAPAGAEVTVLGAGGLSLPDASVSTTAGNPVTVTPLDGVTAPSGLPLRITSLGTPAGGGAAVLGADGTVTYNPAPGASGTVTFTYSATDGHSTGGATVTVAVRPVAAADLYSTGKSATLTASTGVLANDACTGCTVSTTPVAGPRLNGAVSGTLTLSGDGTFTYVPASNATGTVTFTYRATDAAGRGTDGDVTINVADLAPDYATTAYQTAINPLPLQANDPGCSNACRPQAGGAPALGTVVYPTGGGSVVTYTPNAGTWGLDTFSYGVTGNSGGVTTPVTILIAPPPVARQTTYGTEVGAAPPSGGSCGRCVYAPGTAPAHGTVTVDPDTGASTYRPAAGYAGADAYTYQVRDPVTGLRVTGTVSVTVGPRAVDDTAAVLLGDSVTGDAAGNDACPATCTRTLVTGPPSGTLTLHPDGTYTYTPGGDIGTFTATYRIASSVSGPVTADGTITLTVRGAVDDTATTAPGQAVTVDVRANDPCTGCALTAVGAPPSGTAGISGGAVVFTPVAGFTGRARVPYTLTRGGATTTATVVVTVTPRAVDDAVTTVAGTPVEVLPLANDLCAGCTLAITGPPATGTATVDGDVVTYTPAGAGTVTVGYVLTDPSGATATGTVTVRVAAAPDVRPDGATTTGAAPVVTNVLDNDDCTGCTITITTDPGYGTATVDVRGRAVYTAAPGFSGVDTYRYTASDPGTGAYATATVTVTVAPQARDDDAVTRVGVPVDVDVLTDDACTNCTLGTSVTAGPVTVGSGGGTVTVTPAAGWTGIATVTYTATDPVTALSSTATLTVEVDDARPDSATAAPGASVTGLDVLANDHCPGCAVTAVGTASSGTASFQGGTVGWAPPAGFAGVATFGYTASGGAHTVSSTVRILVPPAAAVIAVPAGRAGTVTPVPPADCPACVLTALTSPDHGDVDEASGGFTYTPMPGYTGTDAFEYRLTDRVSKRTVTATATLDVAVRAAAPGLTVTAEAAPGPVTPVPGVSHTWGWTVTNSGDQVLRSITAVANDGGAVSCPATTLTVGAGMRCTAARVFTQAQRDAGEARVRLTVTGTPDAGSAVTDDDEAVVVLAGDTPPAPSASPSAPASPLPSVSASAVPSPAPSPSVGPSPDVSPSPSPSASPTASPTASPSASPSPSPSAPPSASPTVSPSPADGPPPVGDALVTGVIWFDRNQDGDRDDGEWPLPGVPVQLREAPSVAAALAAVSTITAAPPVRSVTTGPDGGYRFGSLPGGAYRVTAVVDAAGFAYTSDSDGRADWTVTVRTGESGAAVAEFAGIGRGSVNGTIYNSGTGDPIGGAAVTCRWAGLDDTLRTTDDVLMAVGAAGSGRFALSRLPFGTYECGGRDPRTGATSAVTQVSVMSTERRYVPLPVSGSRPLPVTGDRVGTLVAAGLLLLLAGAAVTRVGRRH
ncbi:MULTISPECIES: Ig-like domain-containing protein [Catenuloplanes]|uniref:SD-repeat containing protein B domain-containing protein n=1 Tax=Catenuloplanes niger TaxID=587534 RepID=A0AAE4CU20_9ACTN|nr:Ig-like domain-containing protein [Catenuloplanes niger]MDR7325961.1 hypothetical protein [Catenuloplanes niger]